MRTSSRAVMARKPFRAGPSLYVPPTLSAGYPAGTILSDYGHSWLALQDVPRQMRPQGGGSGSTEDRNILLSQRGPVALAANTTGGYDGPTYTVTNTLGTNSPGSLTYGQLGTGLANPNDPLWIVFAPELNGARIVQSVRPNMPANKTIDGRGVPDMVIVPSKGWQCYGINAPNGASTVRLPGASANHIFAFLNLDMDMVQNNQQGFAYGYGTDRIFLHHVQMQGGTDVVFSILLAGSGGAGNAWGVGVYPSVRAELSWVKMGPITTASNIARFPLTGGDNRPENSKAMKFGLDPEDSLYPDNLEVLLHHCLFDGTGQRNPAIDWSRVRMINSHVSRWGLVPGIAKDSTDVAAYAALGKTAIDATYGTAGTHLEHGSKHIAVNNIYTPYEMNEGHAIDPTWPMINPAKNAMDFIGSGQTGLSSSGLWLRDGATKPVDFGTVWTPGQAYADLLTADADLISDLNLGAGNYQPWQLIP